MISVEAVEIVEITLVDVEDMSDKTVSVSFEIERITDTVDGDGIAWS